MDRVAYLRMDMKVLSRIISVGPWILILSFLLAPSLNAQTAEETPAMTAAPPAAVAGSPEAVVDAFGDALAAGDAAAVRALLAADVLIYESGGAERSLEEYASHHMSADMAFVGVMERQLTDRRVFAAGDFAVVTSMGRSRGTFREREMDLLGTETMVLEKHDGNWLIRHIHWSSRPASR